MIITVSLICWNRNSGWLISKLQIVEGEDYWRKVKKFHFQEFWDKQRENLDKTMQIFIHKL